MSVEENIWRDWHVSAYKLTDWFKKWYVIRTDCYGFYPSGESITVHKKLTDEVLRQHCRSTSTAVGVHLVRPGVHTVKYMCVDIDAHENEDSNRNFNFAIHVVKELNSIGISPLLYDSNGAGGFHVDSLFKTEIQAIHARRIAAWATRHWKDFHFDKCPEIFPKQNTVEIGKYGNYVRLPGPHHKRKHYSKVWDGANWLAGQQAIDFMLAHPGSDSSKVPIEVFSYQEPPCVKERTEKPADWQGEYRTDEWWRNYDGNLSTLDIVDLFREGGLLLAEPAEDATTIAVLCPWHGGHSTGDSGTAVFYNGADKFPGFYCHHTHCEERKLAEVLAFFGKEKVDKHCKEWMDESKLHYTEEVLKKMMGEETKEEAVDPFLRAAEKTFGEKVKYAAPKVDTSYHFEKVSSAELDNGDYRHEWLIKNMLVANQPCIVGGPKKALKTSLLVDLAVSLGSGTDFLGSFAVAKQQKTILISGESGEATLQETARRICVSKGIKLSAVDCDWSFRLPQLAREEELDALTVGIAENGYKVVIIDPVYLCLLAGADKQASNIFEMGPLLSQVATSCKWAGATPILIHHTRKNTKTGQLDLDDLAYSGFAEFARQWILVSRREEYEPGTGLHKLWLTVGGSAGHNGLWGIDVDEARLQEDFTGRKWEVMVQSMTDIKDGKKNARMMEEEVNAEDLWKALLTFTQPPSPTKVWRNIGWDKQKFNRALGCLIRQGKVQEVPAPNGNGQVIQVIVR